MRFQSWAEARVAARALKDWLAKHCPTCGKRHTAACIDGGRCTVCGSMLSQVTSLADAVKEAETHALDLQQHKPGAGT